ncbi:hypothetical protein [Chryseosolibacter indicus]|nr:hypothetical protein [Chryseosolibacter indicus]
MKRIIYLIIITIGSCLTISSCTEEEVAPAYENGSNGGTAGTGGF